LLFICVVVAGHGDAAEAKEDRERDYAECFHWGISKYIRGGCARLASLLVAHALELCRRPARAIKFPFIETTLEFNAACGSDEQRKP
jgi:hypothetical protein